MEDFELLDKLGEGAFGVVWKARRKLTGDLFAIKEINEQLEERGDALALPEVEVLRQSDHPNILKLLEVIRSPSATFLVLEYCEGSLGALMHRMRAAQRCFSDAEVRTVARQLLSALQYLQEMGVVHRDIKPENILIKDGQIKLADFGSARFTERPGRMSTYVGTRWYRAPEMLLGASYGYPVDVWAVGTVLGEMYAMEPIFIGSSADDQLYRIFSVRGLPKSWREGCTLAKEKGIYPPSISPPDLGTSIPRASRFALNVLDQCLKVDPSARGTHSSILSMPFFKKPDGVLPAIDSLPDVKDLPELSVTKAFGRGPKQERKDPSEFGFKPTPLAKEAEERIYEEAKAPDILSVSSAGSEGQDGGKPRTAPSRAGETLSEDEGATASDSGPTEEVVPPRVRRIHSAKVKRTKDVVPRKPFKLKRKNQKLKHLASLDTGLPPAMNEGLNRAWSVDFSRLRNLTPVERARYPKKETWLEEANRTRMEKHSQADSDSEPPLPVAKPLASSKLSRVVRNSLLSKREDVEDPEHEAPTLREISRTKGKGIRNTKPGIFEKVVRNVKSKPAGPPSEKGPIWLRNQQPHETETSHPTGWASKDSPAALQGKTTVPGEHTKTEEQPLPPRAKKAARSAPDSPPVEEDSEDASFHQSSSKSRVNPLSICYACMSNSRTPSHHAYAVAAPEVPRNTSAEYSYPSSYKVEPGPDQHAVPQPESDRDKSVNSFERYRNDSKESFTSQSSSVQYGGRASSVDGEGGWYFGDDSDSDAESAYRGRFTRPASRASNGSFHSSRNGTNTPLSAVSAFTTLQRHIGSEHRRSSWLLSKLEKANYGAGSTATGDVNASGDVGDESGSEDHRPSTLPQGSPLNPPVVASPAHPIVSMSEAQLPPIAPIPAPIALRSEHPGANSTHTTSHVAASGDLTGPPSKRPPLPAKKSPEGEDGGRCILCGNEIARGGPGSSKVSSEDPDAISEGVTTSPALSPMLPAPVVQPSAALPARASGAGGHSAHRYDRAHGMGSSVLDMLMASSGRGSCNALSGSNPQRPKVADQGTPGKTSHSDSKSQPRGSPVIDRHPCDGPSDGYFPPRRGLERFSEVAELSRIREETDV